MNAFTRHAFTYKRQMQLKYIAYMLLKLCFTKTSVLRALHKQLFLENLPKVASVSCLTKCDDKKMGFTVPFLDYKYVKPWKFAECV